MATTNQYTIDGQMIGYHDGSARKDYLTDHLGSVTAEIAQNGTTRTFDGRYKPMGANLWATGTRGSFGWVGTWGYRTTGLIASSHYVRARHYSQLGTQWTTVDLLWPRELAYTYVAGMSTSAIDPTGLDNCAFRAQTVPGMAVPKGNKKPPSKASSFRKCQQYLEWANQAVGVAGQVLICPGGKKQICEECSKATGYPINCDGYPKCNSAGRDIVQAGGLGDPIYPFGRGVAGNEAGCLMICLSYAFGDHEEGYRPPQWQIAECTTMCSELIYRASVPGCDALFNLCNKWKGESSRRENCMNFYLTVCWAK